MNKESKRVERYFKGVANHHRISIIKLLNRAPDLTLDEISGRLEIHFKTASAHLFRLVHAGLVEKKYQGRYVKHRLSPYGKIIHDFLTAL